MKEGQGEATGGLLCYLLSTALLFLVDALRISTAMMFSYTASTATMLLITTHWKISIDIIGTTRPAVALSYAYFSWNLIAFTLLPPII